MAKTRALPQVATGRAPEFLLDAYRGMQTIRMFEQQVLQLSRGDAPEVVGSVHLCAGQEAIPVGALAALNPDDRVVATYRGHGWALESGITPDELMAEICHRAAGINGGRAGLRMSPRRSVASWEKTPSWVRAGRLPAAWLWRRRFRTVGAWS